MYRYHRLLAAFLLSTMLFATRLIAGAEDWRIALCISADPVHKMNVSWRCETRLDRPLVQFIQNSPLAKFQNLPLNQSRALVEEVRGSDSSLIYVYSGEMSGLEAQTAYAYRVGGGESWSEWFVFRTASEEAEPFQFIYLGDPQNGLMTHVPRAFRAAYSAAPDAAFMTMAGDLVSVPDDDQQWQDLFHAGGWIFGKVPQVPVMGNHAYYYQGQWQKAPAKQWRQHFALPTNGLASLPETNYYFLYQDLLFVVLNGNTQRKEQAKWLDELLSREKAHWIILSMHQPLYSTGEGRDGSKMRDAFLPVIDKHQVDLVLQGHDHTFGRTFPLKGGVVVKKREKGTVYINSVSGSKQYELEPMIGSVFAVTDADKQFYHVIDVQPSTLTLWSYTVDGKLKDTVTIKPASNR
ncbi:MAG: metallophosphoesterase family protein [Candidatus Marinimicrobia bacterium]|nr:metallophosphoesterase family protein [Candidatus Neomarinimicrobiota bacterium]